MEQLTNKMCIALSDINLLPVMNDVGRHVGQIIHPHQDDEEYRRKYQKGIYHLFLRKQVHEETGDEKRLHTGNGQRKSHGMAAQIQL